VERVLCDRNKLGAATEGRGMSSCFRWRNSYAPCFIDSMFFEIRSLLAVVFDGHRVSLSCAINLANSPCTIIETGCLSTGR